MTPAGHVLVGVAIGVLCMPDFARRRPRLKHLVLFGAAATIPDWPLPLWGHVRYDISHSLFVTLLAILLLAVIHSQTPSGRDGRGWNYFGCLALAWISHLLLDSFYNHGYGVAIYYPFSQGRLILPVPWLSIAIDPRHPFSPENLRIVILECLTFFRWFAVTITLRHLIFKFKLSHPEGVPVYPVSSEITSTSSTICADTAEGFMGIATLP